MLISPPADGGRTYGGLNLDIRTKDTIPYCHINKRQEAKGKGQEAIRNWQRILNSLNTCLLPVSPFTIDHSPFTKDAGSSEFPEGLL